MKRILINGDWRETGAEDVAEALAELGYGGATVVTALNERFLPSGVRASTRLAEGDRLEVLAPMQGG